MRDQIESDFEFLEVYGASKWGQVLLTSYFEPELEGSKQPTALFSRPLYQVPEDLMELSFGDDRFKEMGQLRGRLQWDKDKKRQKVISYFSREEIDAGKALSGKKLEWCYVDPVDAFTLQIQGSGTIQLEKGEKIRLGYADQNGWPYVPVGKFLKEFIPIEKITLPYLEQFLKKLNSEEQQKYLNKNPSYTFFRKLEGEPQTSLGNSVFPGRTIAIDSRFFPKGAVGFLSFKKPVFADASAVEPAS
jgi:membrane-bound lytic murein transglycosylase A